jgi:hypothetical protein
VALSDDIAELADGAVERLRADLVEVLARLRSYLRDLLAKAEVDAEGRVTVASINAQIAAGLARDLVRVLGEIGYDAAADRAIDEFDRMADTVQQGLGASFSTVTREGLVAFVGGVVAELTQHVPAEAAEALRVAMLAGIASHAIRDDLVEELARRAEITLRQAVTEVDTAIMAFARESLTTTAEEGGFDLFRCDGPKDGLNRPFCSRHVNRVYTSGDLDAEDNGQGLEPTSRFLGGYQCRHSLSPVTIEEARAMVEEDGQRAIGGPEARRIVLRGRPGPNETAFVAENLGTVVKRDGRQKVVRRTRAA